MRIKFDPPAKNYNYGTKRVKIKFLFLPKKINHELRWLERGMWIQEVDYTLHFYDYGLTKFRKYFWRDVEWLDKYGVEEKGVGEWADL